MSRIIRTLGIAGVLAAAFAVFAISAGAASKGKGKADSGTVYTAITHTAGGYEYAAGNDVDKLLGNAAAVYKIKTGGSTKNGITLDVPFVGLYTSTGEISGTGTAVLSVTGTTETVSKGTLKLTKGSGGQKGHTFIGTFTGTGDTKTGQFVFKVKGTYK